MGQLISKYKTKDTSKKRSKSKNMNDKQKIVANFTDVTEDMLKNRRCNLYEYAI